MWKTAVILTALVSLSIAKASTIYIGGGESILNSLSDPKGRSYQIDQSSNINKFGKHWSGGPDLGYLNLGHQDGLKTDGIFGLYVFSDRFGSIGTFGGMGPYLSATTVPLGNGNYRDQYGVSLMTTAGIKYYAAHWRLRFSWERLTTWRNLDEDVILLSLGRKL